MIKYLIPALIMTLWITVEIPATNNETNTTNLIGNNSVDLPPVQTVNYTVTFSAKYSALPAQKLGQIVEAFLTNHNQACSLTIKIEKLDQIAANECCSELLFEYNGTTTQNLSGEN